VRHETRSSAENSSLNWRAQYRYRFLREGNLDLNAPLRWSVYGDDY
jgi:hypothetical protein